MRLVCAFDFPVAARARTKSKTATLSCKEHAEEKMSSLNNFQPDYAPAPGALLLEHRKANSLTQSELAIRLGLDKKTVNQIENDHHPITTETALKLETVMGLPAHIWSGLEARYRELP